MIAHTIRKIMADWVQDPDGMIWLNTILFCIDYNYVYLQTNLTFVNMHKCVVLGIFCSLLSFIAVINMVYDTFK